MSAAGGFVILTVWLCGPLVLAGRRSGLVLTLVGALLASGVPILHMQGAGLVGRRIPPNTSGAFFWVWTNIAMGASGMVSLILAARALWRLRRGQLT